MECEEAQELVHAYVDRELDLVRSLDFERHLTDCHACAESCASLQALRSAVKRVYRTPPASLQRRVTSRVRKASNKEAAPHVMPWRWIGVAASVGLVLVVGWSVVRLSARLSADEMLEREVVSGHVRSLMSNHPVDVPASDQHTVKPWFSGKLDFSPPVTDLDEQGFILVGGRLDYLGGRAVAALVYQRRKHFINVFIWPTDEADRSGRTATVQGYNISYWRQSDMSCWAVSDLNRNELTEFADLFRSRSSQAAQ